MVSCPHNNGDSAGGCCTIPAGMLVNANGECDQAVIVKRARKIPCCGTQPTSANIDYTAALKVELDRYVIDNGCMPLSESKLYELATRLNSVVKAQQNCA